MFDLVRIEGLSQVEAAGLLYVSRKDCAAAGWNIRPVVTHGEAKLIWSHCPPLRTEGGRIRRQASNTRRRTLSMPVRTKNSRACKGNIG